MIARSGRISEAPDGPDMLSGPGRIIGASDGPDMLSGPGRIVVVAEFRPDETKSMNRSHGSIRLCTHRLCPSALGSVNSLYQYEPFVPRTSNGRNTRYHFFHVVADIRRAELDDTRFACRAPNKVHVP